MPDGIVSKGAAKVKAEKTKSDKAKVEKGRADRKPDNIFQQMAKFVRESYVEVVKKAAWASWPELKKFTAIVIFAVVVVGVWIGGLDFIFGRIFQAAGIGH